MMLMVKCCVLGLSLSRLGQEIEKSGLGLIPLACFAVETLFSLLPAASWHQDWCQ